jgi:UDP-galactopyranose mutase
MNDFHFILIGPVVKIDYKDLPKHENIHYLGGKKYEELPAYLAHWDVAFLPFAKNDSTKFISPTKTPEYLCAGKPVVSTSIHDVIDPYGISGLVQIADSVNDFSEAIMYAMKQKDDQQWKNKTKEFLSTNSWDLTYAKMKKIILDTLEKKDTLNVRSHRILTETMADNERHGSDVKIRIL